MESKFVFGGPVGAGKTTAISSISDIPVVKTEAAATDEVAQRKANTTVAMDYGILHLQEGLSVHVYGTPGQERFSFMWDILTTGALGLVLLFDNVRPRPLDDVAFYVKGFRKFLDRTGNALAVGVTRMEVAATPTLAEYRGALGKLNLHVPVFEVDARQRADVRNLLLALLATLDPATRRR